MQLTPRYGTDPLILLDGPPSAIAAPAVRQARRFAERLAGLDDAQWAQPSRCDGWSARDVVAHLESAFSFWVVSVTSALAGTPTTYLSAFDPVETPRQIVAGTAGLGPAEVLERFVRTTTTLTELFASLDDDGWATLAEAPPGHLPVHVLAHHALWDSWVHERDVFLPLGETPPEEPDEVLAALRYVAALGPAFDVSRGEGRTGVLAIEVTAPDATFVVEAGVHRVEVRAAGAGTEADLRLGGDAVELLEALSIRRPLGRDVAPEAGWLLRGLAEVFDAAPA